MKVLPGSDYPLGATLDGSGTNFSIFSEVAEHVELCLFDSDGNETRVELPEMSGYCHHGYLPGIRPGRRYGYRVHGPWAPENGRRCCPGKLPMDPYAKAVEGNIQWNDTVYPYRVDDPEGPPNDEDDARFMPKSIVIDPFFNWRSEHAPGIPLEETIIYEVHVKGATQRHPAVPAELHGTNDNRSWNCGAEGETDDPRINALRARQTRNFLVTLRKNHPVFRRRGWFQGRSIRGQPDIGWYRTDGSEMTEEDWDADRVKSLQVFLSGHLNQMDRRGEAVLDDDFLVLFHADAEPAVFRPAVPQGDCPWQLVLNTADETVAVQTRDVQRIGGEISAQGRSMIVLSRPRR